MLTKNSDPKNYWCSGYDIGFDLCSQFLSLNDLDKHVIVFYANHGLSVNTDNRKKNVLDLNEGRTDRLNDITITAENKYSDNITKSREKISLILHDNAVFVC